MIKDGMHHPFDLQVKPNGEEPLLPSKAPAPVGGFCPGATANPSRRDPAQDAQSPSHRAAFKIPVPGPSEQVPRQPLRSCRCSENTGKFQ